MNKVPPMVSVLMPVYNGMPYLPLAVESILSQTLSNFELIIVNDCSNDDSASYLRSLTDDRVVLLHLPENGGITVALQEGLKRVKGKFVARLDSDDIAKPDRLEKQANFLSKNQDVGLIGSCFETIDFEGNFIKRINKRVTDIEIRWKILFKNPFVHSTVMFRYDLIQNYQLGYIRKHGEDYQLWIDMLGYCRGMIISDNTIQYRMHPQSWTYIKGNEQADAGTAIAANQVKKYIDESNTKLVELIQWVRGKSSSQSNNSEMGRLYTKLLRGFIKRNIDSVSFQFVKNRLRLMRKRMGLLVYLRMDFISIYCYSLRFKFR